MRLWRVVLLVNLALALGVGGGYLWWGRRAERLERELAQPRTPATLGEREWRVRGVVRAILPDINVIIISHEEIPGYMAPMTMGFPMASAKISNGVQVGDAVRFTVRGMVMVTAVEKLP